MFEKTVDCAQRDGLVFKNNNSVLEMFSSSVNVSVSVAQAGVFF